MYHPTYSKDYTNVSSVCQLRLGATVLSLIVYQADTINRAEPSGNATLLTFSTFGS